MLSIIACTFAEIKTIYHNNGNIKAEYEIDSSSTLNGIYKVFDTNGKMKIIGEYKKGNKSGIWNYYSENGTIGKTEFYSEDGKMLYSEYKNATNTNYNQQTSPVMQTYQAWNPCNNPKLEELRQIKLADITVGQKEELDKLQNTCDEYQLTRRIEDDWENRRPKVYGGIIAAICATITILGLYIFIALKN